MSEKLPPGTLCAVCEDLATGNHYSVASCNGCKTFFRRAIVNKRNFVCMGNGNCAVNKGVRCACRHCRLNKCLSVGMDTNSIQNDRDRIGYTKRTRKNEKERGERGDSIVKQECTSHYDEMEDSVEVVDLSPIGSINGQCIENNLNSSDPLLERLTSLENNFTLLLSRARIEPYATLDDALGAPSIFHQPIEVKVTDPIVSPQLGDEQKRMPFWRSRIIALYIDWAKTFSTFQSLPQSDKIALITNHASSYMIMCEAFRTPDHTDESALNNYLLLNDLKSGVKKEPSYSKECTPSPPDMIRLPTEYGSLPGDYGTWLPADYGRPVTGREGRSNLHTFFDPHLFVDSNRTGNENGPKMGEAPFNSTYPIVGSLSGLTPVMACMIDYVMKPFRQLNISTAEFAALQAIMFFDPDTDGIDSASQRNVAAEQKRIIGTLYKYICQQYDTEGAQERYTSILLRISTIRKVAAKKNESLQIIDLFNLFTLNSLVKETVGLRSNAATPNGLAQAAREEA